MSFTSFSSTFMVLQSDASSYKEILVVQIKKTSTEVEVWLDMQVLLCYTDT